jgi:acylphosphatase
LKNPSATRRRATVVYSGRVQGVGFRYTTVRLAEAYPGLTGYVMNQFDGTVLLVAEGEEDVIRSFLGDIRQSGLGRYIVDLRVDWGPATGKFEGFQVRYG